MKGTLAPGPGDIKCDQEITARTPPALRPPSALRGTGRRGMRGRRARRPGKPRGVGCPRGEPGGSRRRRGDRRRHVASRGPGGPEMRTSEAAGRSGGRRREEEFNIHFDGFARFLFFLVGACGSGSAAQASKFLRLGVAAAALAPVQERQGAPRLHRLRGRPSRPATKADSEFLQ